MLLSSLIGMSNDKIQKEGLNIVFSLVVGFLILIT